MKYKHAQAKTVEELDIKVQEMLDGGWILCGTPYTAGNMFFQCIHTPEEEQDSGLTANDVATISLLRGLGRGPRRF